MWMYKVCVGSRRRYTVVAWCSDKESAEISRRDFAFSSRKGVFVKRYSEKEM